MKQNKKYALEDLEPSELYEKRKHRSNLVRGKKRKLTVKQFAELEKLERDISVESIEKYGSNFTEQ